MIPTQDNVYAAYDDFSNNFACTGDACNIRVSLSYGVNPPDFTVDNQSGTATGGINPGHRLAIDPRNDPVYSLFQQNLAPEPEVRKTSTTCSTALRMAEPHGP
jgi:hypothetical protein